MKKDILDFEKILKTEDVEPASMLIVLSNEILPIWNLLEKNDYHELKKPLKYYIVIRLVSYTEVFFSNLVRYLIDDLQMIPEEIFSNNKITINLEDFEKIKSKEKISKGRIISHSFNFQNLKEIDQIMSKFIENGTFLSMISKTVEKIKIKEPSKIPNYKFNWEQFHNLFQLRHDIIHRLNSNEEITNDLLLRLTMYTTHFIAVSYSLFAINLTRQIEKASRDYNFEIDKNQSENMLLELLQIKSSDIPTCNFVENKVSRRIKNLNSSDLEKN